MPVTLVPERRAWAVAMLLVSMAGVPAIAQERGPETRVPETLVPETLGPETLEPQSAAWDLERAFVEMERLQAEVALLRRLGEAQAALLAWNRERANSRAGPAALSAKLCAEPALAIWCGVLPATFGADAAEPADDGHGKDGER